MAYFTHGISTIVFSCGALALSLPASGQTVGESFFVEEVPAHVPAHGEEYYGGVTAGPGEYFAVWLDLPGGLSAWGDVYGTRILPDGSFAAPGSLEIFSDSDRIATGFPTVAWNGSVYLVVWHEIGPSSEDILYGARVDQFGNVLDPGGFVIDVFDTPNRRTAVASDGQDFLVVQTGTNGSLVGVRVGGDGIVLDAEPITISSGATGLGFPQLTWAAGVYMVVWAQALYHYDSEGARVDADGIVLDQPHIEVATGAAWQVHTASATDGTNFLCVFDDEREGPIYYYKDLYGVRVTPQGEPIESTGIAIDTRPNFMARDPYVIFGGGQYAVVYVNDAQPVTAVQVARVLPDGTVLDPDGITVHTDSSNSNPRNPRIAWNGTDYCVVWHDGNTAPGETPLRYALLGHDGTIKVPTTNVPDSDSHFSYYDIASDGEGFVVIWQEWTGCSCMRSAGISGAGTLIESNMFSPEAGGGFIAWNGQTYLVAWTQWDGGSQYLRARPLGPTGAPTGPIVEISGPHPSLTPFGLFPDGAGFQLISTGHRLFDLDADGMPLGEPIMFSAPSGFEPKWARGPGGTFLQSFSRWASNPYNGVRARGRIVDFSPALPGDLDRDGSVGFNDLLIVLASWGACPAPPRVCPADIDDSGDVGFNDLLILLASWSD